MKCQFHDDQSHISKPTLSLVGKHSCAIPFPFVVTWFQQSRNGNDLTRPFVYFTALTTIGAVRKYVLRNTICSSSFSIGIQYSETHLRRFLFFCSIRFISFLSVREPQWQALHPSGTLRFYG